MTRSRCHGFLELIHVRSGEKDAKVGRGVDVGALPSVAVLCGSCFVAARTVGSN
jgi:hypothetical protein